jgi:hypothetical protein
MTFHIERQTSPMTGQNGPWRSVAFPVKYLIIRIYLGCKSEGAAACSVWQNRTCRAFSEVKGLTYPLEDGIGELGVSDSNLAEQVQVGGHHDSGTEVNGRRETRFVRKVVG